VYRKYKLPNHQNGQVYLTSHRICYVDKEAPRKHSVALDLKEVERYEFYVSSRLPVCARLEWDP
jgi:ESCRT-II complex subunit VPS36